MLYCHGCGDRFVSEEDDLIELRKGPLCCDTCGDFTVEFKDDEDYYEEE